MSADLQARAGGGPLLAVLLLSGGAWSLTMPFLKIAAGAGYSALTLLFWQNLIMAGLAAVLLRVSGRPWPRLAGNRAALIAVSVFGTVLPGYFTFLTAGELPVGVRAIVIAMVPIFALPIALALGFERFEPRRLAGLLLGIGAIALLVLPGQGGGPVPTAMVLLAALSPLAYAVEANVLAARPATLDPLGLLFAASTLSLALTFVLALPLGALELPRGFGLAEQALAVTAPINLFAYAAYVWLAGRSGAVFASQVGYVVTIGGIIWGMLLLGERPGPMIWLSLGVMIAGLALVRPRAATIEGA